MGLRASKNRCFVVRSGVMYLAFGIYDERKYFADTCRKVPIFCQPVNPLQHPPAAVYPYKIDKKRGCQFC